jgi:hypothetical protein
MNDMKCPFCQQELKPQTMDGEWLECWNCSYHEPSHHPFPQRILCSTKELWLELIRTRKALDVAVDAIKNATEYLGNQEPLVDVMAMNLHTDLSKALEQITALEQKDVK